jgi:hypothetical protein
MSQLDINTLAAQSGSVIHLSSHVSGSSTSTGSFGRVEAANYSGDGSALTGISIPSAADISGSFEGGGSTNISGSSTSTGSFGRVETDNLTVDGSQGSDGEVLTSTGTGVAWEEVGGGLTWNVITANTNATTSNGYFIDTSSSAITLTLPASPTLGDQVVFNDYAGNALNNNITIARNSEKIQGDASDLVVNTSRASNTLVYSGSAQGWLLTNI